MQESVMYQAIRREAIQENMRQVASNLLNEGVSLEVIARVIGLSIEQIQQLQAIAPQEPSL